MGKIDLTINKAGLEHNIQKAKENNIIIPTIAQMQNPDLIPEKIKAKLSNTGLWDVDPVNLFRISWHNEAKEKGGLFQAVAAVAQLILNVRIAHNGSCNQLGKHGDIRAEAYRVPLRGQTAVNVGGVADKLKGVETYSHRQSKAQQRKGKPGCGIEVADEEIRVFEVNQQGKAYSYGNSEEELGFFRALAEFFNKQTENISADYGSEHQKDVFRFAPSVKNKAGKQQNRIFQLVRRDEVQNEHRGKKIIEKWYA